MLHAPVAHRAAPPAGADLGMVRAIVEGAPAERCRCPRCGAASVQRWGVRAGLQRWRCRACGRTFNALTGTPLARLRRRELWLGHAAALKDGLSLRAIGRQLGLHYNTTLRWRHRWLHHPRELKDDGLHGVVELDAVLFRDCPGHRQRWRRVAISRDPTKGTRAAIRGDHLEPVLVLVARDRMGATTDAILPALDAPSIAAALGDLLDPARATPCSGNPQVLRASRRQLPILPAADDPAGAAGGASHCQEVRGYTARLERWMQRFRGVSTHHLDKYLGWRRALERQLRPPWPWPWHWLRLALGRDQPATVTRSSGGGSVGRATAAALATG